MLSIKKSSILIISDSENFLCETEWFFTKKDLSLPKTRYLYLRWSFFFYETKQYPTSPNQAIRYDEDFKAEVIEELLGEEDNIVVEVCPTEAISIIEKKSEERS